MISHVIYVSSPTSDSQESPGFGLTGEKAEKCLVSFVSHAGESTKEPNQGSEFSIFTVVSMKDEKGAEKRCFSAVQVSERSVTFHIAS